MVEHVLFYNEPREQIHPAATGCWVRIFVEDLLQGVPRPSAAGSIPGGRRMIAVEAVVERYLERKSVGETDGGAGGTYASNAASILRRWVTWLERECEVTEIDVVSERCMRAYATELAARTEVGEYTASTAGTYFAVVRAFLSWCVAEGFIAENPAESDEAAAPLPAVEGVDRAQHWSTEKRTALERYVSKRADEDVSDPNERLARLREYALVAVLAHTGIRGVELFRVPEDERRTGATWGDVDFYTGTIRVLGTGRTLEDVSLPAPARQPLRRYRVVLDPPTNDWPLFPTRHAPSISRRVRSVLESRGHDENEIDEIMAEKKAIEVARERAIAPAAITTEGARSILKRLCADAEVDIDGDYLKPRGARQGHDGPETRTDATTAHDALRASVQERSMVVFEDTPEPASESDSRN